MMQPPGTQTPDENRNSRDLRILRKRLANRIPLAGPAPDKSGQPAVEAHPDHPCQRKDQSDLGHHRAVALPTPEHILVRQDQTKRHQTD